MKNILHKSFSLPLLLIIYSIACMPLSAYAAHAPAVRDLLNRIGGKGAANRFITQVDTSLAEQGCETFIITSQNNKPCIKGSSVLAVTTGINWYLNHTAHINLAWNKLTTDLTTATLPLPQGTEKHVCQADYRYYLNYCTFSYSMSTWTWERWQQEIDWMALHGINMPLQIVGLDVVWRNLLIHDLGYTADEANKFVAGPCFQAWWGMNNLEGWGGANPDWWYTRQANLAKKILSRERELGMEPVLPGYAGMVPSNIEHHGYKANSQGKWCAFMRPYILDPNSQAFADIAAKYYERLREVMGTSKYYSMDPFHEGANTEGIDVPSAYAKIARAMTTARADSKWVIQFWQWTPAQYNVLSQVEKGKLIVLDLFSDGHTHFDKYQNHDAVYCMLPNYGGRTGFFGRLGKVMTDYFTQRSQHANIKGIGATPEAIGQVPVLYDALFELPWRTTAPDPARWTADYATSRYGQRNTHAQAAWQLMRCSALNCPNALQGPHEATFCARPALQVDYVSSWGGTDMFYDAQDVIQAAQLLSYACDSLSNDNFSYDLTDFVRQALTDYGYYLLRAINEAHQAGNYALYTIRRDAYLQLMLDVDALLATNSAFTLGEWVQMARHIADEAKGTTEADRQWLELDNARTLITTWGSRAASEDGGLRDYSYREWAGMLKDFYYPRWKKFFVCLENREEQPDWFASDWAWAHNASLTYSDRAVGSTSSVAKKLLSHYFIPLAYDGQHTYYLSRHICNEVEDKMCFQAQRGQTFTLPLSVKTNVADATLGADFNGDGQVSEDETVSGLTISIPTSVKSQEILARLCLADGTTLSFSILL